MTKSHYLIDEADRLKHQKKSTEKCGGGRGTCVDHTLTIYAFDPGHTKSQERSWERVGNGGGGEGEKGGGGRMSRDILFMREILHPSHRPFIRQICIVTNLRPTVQ
jgi:hypothetical protein